MNITLPQIKLIAKNIKEQYGYTEDGIPAKHTQILDLISLSLTGHKFNTLKATFQEEKTKKFYYGATRTGKTEQLLKDITPLGLLSKKEQVKIVVAVSQHEENTFRKIIPYATYLMNASILWTDFISKKVPEDKIEKLPNEITTIIIDGDVWGAEEEENNFIKALNNVDFYIATQRIAVKNLFGKYDLDGLQKQTFGLDAREDNPLR